MAALAYWILQRMLIGTEGENLALRRAVGYDRKGKISPVLYLADIALTFWYAWAPQKVYALAALMWLVPDRRIESALDAPGGKARQTATGDSATPSATSAS